MRRPSALPVLRHRRRFVLAVAVLALVGSTAAAAKEPPVTAKDFHVRKFDRSTTIDNKWLPLKPGTQFVFAGATMEGKVRVPHRLVYTVTDLVKVVGGVRNVVVWDRDYTSGQLVEAELSYFAQDNQGYVWHTGEYPEEYENGKFVRSPAWLADVKGSTAGIEMLPDPRKTSPDYSQGYAPPPVSWTDRAKIHKAHTKTCVPYRCYPDVLVTAEYNSEEPGQYQLKYYARGVGPVRVGWLGPDASKEVLGLVGLVHLGPAGLAAARTQALRLEQRAYRIKKDVFGGTPRATRR